ncbi:GNAT family N-acetyltransferase [Acaryochloris marina NIES-2412]|uniref:GNAT family N-acetyltransferase n=1 Tax=Acaryochloris marina TaxID=155978 RepID=UPI0040590C9A
MKRIQLASESDVLALAYLYRQTVLTWGPQYYTPAQVTAWANFASETNQFRAFILQATTFVARNHTGILGFAGIAEDGHVTSAYVRQDCIHQGIGSALMRNLLEYAQSRCIQRLYAEASEFSLGLFKKFGFQLYETEIVERHGVKFQRFLVELKLIQNKDCFMDSVTFRPAGKADCHTIAELYSISSDGVADYIWTQLAAPGEDILDVGQRRYERENTLFSYQNCTLATINDVIAGMIVAFPMIVDDVAEPEDDPVLAPYSKLEADKTYYICGIAVFSNYREQGIGSQLMKLAETHAVEKGFGKLSLIVFEENSGAKHLYNRLGYQEIAREAIVPHPLIHYSGDAILMVRTI